MECKWRRQISWFWAYIWLHCILSTLWLAGCCQQAPTDHGPASCDIAGSKRRSLLTAGDDNEMFMTSLNVTPKTTEQHLIACSDKFVAYVTNNKRLCSTFCTIEANDRHKASCSLSATKELLVFLYVHQDWHNNYQIYHFLNRPVIHGYHRFWSQKNLWRVIFKGPMPS